jgi:eukaryotic-like serine/threonine-protein kinase
MLLARVPQLLPPGSVLADRYVIEARLGDGGMGCVYRARHIKVGRAFAIKVLHASLTNKASVLRRFEREAELAGRLRHTNVASVVDVAVTDENIHFMAMELAPGTSLAHILHDEGAMAESRVLDLAKQLCAGLSHAHDLGLIHRDFKPENVIVEQLPGGREVARIVDWGVAILREDAAVDVDTDERLTTRGIVVGTPHYMAPEQARGDGLDHRTDLFALGLLCYELLTGKLPFEGSGVEVARANLECKIPPVAARAPEVAVDPVLEAIVMRLLEKDRELRPPSADAVRELLELYERDRGACATALGLALPVTPPPRDPERDRLTEELVREPSRRPIAILVLATAAALAILLYLGLRGGSRPAHAPAHASEPAEPTEPGEPGDLVVRREEPREPPQPLPLPTPHEHDIAVPVPTPRAPARKLAAREHAATPVEDPALFAPPPSATDVAQLYASLGRELKALEEAKGMESTLELWPRYRWIRIHEWMETAERRVRVSEMLERLRADVRATRSSM